MRKLGVDSLDVKSKKVFVRVDFNVPLKNGEIVDHTRIDSALSTIKSLLDRGARVGLCSHLGRPNGPDASLSLAPVAKYLANVLSKKVRFCTQMYGDNTVLSTNALEDGEILLFENIRFFPEEEQNDPKFSELIAQNFDLYVNDAFGAAHRKHASTYGVATFFKNAAAGYLMQKELNYLSQALDDPKRPFLVILGGAKVKDKIKVVLNLLHKADAIIIGGGMAYTFLHLKGESIGRSIIDKENFDIVQKALNFAKKNNKKILLPIDHKVAKNIDANLNEITITDKIPPDQLAFDIGPKTVQLFGQEILNSKLLIWNGPMGVYEKENFIKGTLSLANYLKNCSGTSIIGGGDLIAAVSKSDDNVKEIISHISTGGGASLELLEGTKLPGVEILANEQDIE